MKTPVVEGSKASARKAPPPPERLADGDGGEEWARFLAPGAAAGVVPK
jgi:hypothetical protein